jgi:hypothetical protein
VEEQQHQNQVDERVGPNNSNENGNDGHDASVTVSSVASERSIFHKVQVWRCRQQQFQQQQEQHQLPFVVLFASYAKRCIVVLVIVLDIIIIIIGNIQPY